jgi:hypothetical protein
VQIADICLPQRRRLPRELADKAQRLEVIDRFEMIFQRLAADCNAVLDHHPRFGGGQRVALDRIRRVGQLDIVRLVEVFEAVRRLRPEPVELSPLGGDLP